MVQPGIGLDTPRTNLGDATYLTNVPDFDMSQEQSFQSPGKDTLFQQLQKGGRRGINLKTPRNRAPFGDRRNLPMNALGPGEFTPLLKSATRNSAMKFGKENGIPQTPAFLKQGSLKDIPEDTPLPHMSSAMYEDDNRNSSYVNGMPVPQMDSSTASTPMAFPPRREKGNNVLDNGNQLSLREQEQIIDKIEKENFGLKLKIHFLEEALRKAGPGFSEAALKENTELKVDKVTMQRELHRYRKTLTSAERDLETYRQQILEMQQKVKQKHANEGQREEIERLQRALEEREAEVEDLREQILAAERDDAEVEKLRDQTGDLEADLREKDRLVDERDDEIEELNATIKVSKRRELELEEQAQSGEELEEARDTIKDLEQDIKKLQADLEKSGKECQAAMAERERAQADLEELQGEMANKSITTKGLNRQIEEKVVRLQDELEEYREKQQTLEQQLASKDNELEVRAKKLERYSTMEDELRCRTDEKDLLQIRHDALTSESSDLQRDLAKARATIEDLEDKLDHEKTLALKSEREVRDQYKNEIGRLSDDVEDLRAELQEKERLHDEDSDKWESQRRTLEQAHEQAQDEVDSLRETIEKLQAAEGNLTGKEAKLQQRLEAEKERHSREEASLKRQLVELNSDIDVKQQELTTIKSELSSVKEELRLSQREQKALVEKVQGLEDEIEVLQTNLDEETEKASADLAEAKKESRSLRNEIQSLQDRLDKQMVQSPRENLNSNLRDAEAQLESIRKDKQDLQDQLGKLSIELHAMRTAAAGVEAERDELRSQLKDTKQHEEDTFRLDQEKIELRTSKMKLDSEARRLKDEIRVLTTKIAEAETRLQEETERASAEEEYLKKEIAEARVKEAQHVQRETEQKQTVRNLKQQVAELERKAHDMEVSRMQIASPHSSVSGSARKSEIIEVRHQLAIAHETLRALRAQLKDVEKESTRKATAATIELQTKTSAWDNEKFNLERDLEQAVAAKEELLAKNATAEQTTSRLRSKIQRLEKELHAQRRNATEDQTLALERQDLHDMLRDTQIQAEELELVVKDQEKSLAKLTIVESELRSQIKKLREERHGQRARTASVQHQLEQVESEFRMARKRWEDEKRSLSRGMGVRFPNLSMSTANNGNESLLREAEERDKRHVKELRGLMMQIEWLRARCRREEGLRADAAYAKRFMMLQIELFGACNQADLRMLEQMGITPDKTTSAKRPSLRTVFIMVRAGVRMKRGAEHWAKSRKIHERLVSTLEVMRRKQKKISY